MFPVTQQPVPSRAWEEGGGTSNRRQQSTDCPLVTRLSPAVHPLSMAFCPLHFHPHLLLPCVRLPTLPPHSYCLTSGSCLTSSIDSPLTPLPPSPHLSTPVLIGPTPTYTATFLFPPHFCYTHCVLRPVLAWSSRLLARALGVASRSASLIQAPQFRLLPGWGRVIYTICGVPCSRFGTCPVVYHGARQGQGARPPPRELRRHTHTPNRQPS